MHTDRTVDILVFHQTGAGSSVGIYQTINTEVAVMGPFTAITAVQVLCLAVLSNTGVDCVVTPLPDETAAHDVMLLDELPVVFQVAGAVAHGVCIFAHQEGLVRVGVQITLQTLQGRVHIAVQVDVGEIILTLAAAVLAALIMGQTSGIEMLGPGKGCLEAASVGAFITHGPADDRGAVLVTLDAALGAVHGCFQKFGIICEGFVPGFHMVLPDVIFLAVQRGSAMTFVISFVNDEKSVLITQLVEHGSIRIVAGADGIEVVLLDHSQIPLHVLDADDGAGYGIGVMTVDTAEFDGVSIQENHVVLDVNLPEADAISDDFIRGFQKQGVQVGLFGIPESGVLNREDCLMGVSTAFKSLDRTGTYGLFCCIQQLDLGGNKLTVIGKPDADSGSLFIQQCCGKVIPNAAFGALQDVYIPEDTRGTELILILQVAAVAPFQDHHCQRVLAFPNRLGNIEFGSGVGDFVVAQKGTVEPEIEAGVNTLEVQISLGSIRVAFIHKVVQICTTGILIRDKGRICGEGITDVGVLVPIIAVVLPDAGNRDGIPVGSVVSGCVELVGQFVNARKILEFPVAIQELKAVRMFPVLYQIIHSVGCGDEVCTIGGCAEMMGMQIFVVSWYNHFIPSCFLYPLYNFCSNFRKS